MRVGSSSWFVHGSLAAAFLWLGASGCDVTLVRDLSREQADDAARVLDRSGVVGRAVAEDVADSRWRIDVDGASVAAGVAALSANRARAMCPNDEAPSSASRWIETPGEERARHASQLSAQLERSLARLPGVIEARVHVTLPFGMNSLPETQTPAAASALVVRETGSASAAVATRELIAGALPTLLPSEVRVVESIAPPTTAPTPQFARFGPVVVTRDSANALKLWIAGSLLVNILLAAAVLRPFVKRRNTKQ
jgi:type III secretion protein J